MPFDGSVSLKNPDVDVMLLEYYGLDQNNIPEKPYDVFIGRRVSPLNNFSNLCKFICKILYSIFSDSRRTKTPHFKAVAEKSPIYWQYKHGCATLYIDG